MERQRVRLEYLKNSRECGLRMWNVIEPRLPHYSYEHKGSYPTFALETLREKGLIP